MRAEPPPRALALRVEAIEDAPDPKCVDWIAEPMPADAGLPLPVTTGNLRLMDVRGDDRLAMIGRPFLSAWSPDGALWATAKDDGLVVWDVATGRARTAIPWKGGRTQPREFAVSADGALVVLAGMRAGKQPVLTVVRTTDGRTLLERTERASNVRFDARGEHLVANEGTLDLTTGSWHADTAPSLREHPIVRRMDDGTAIIRTELPHRRVRLERREISTGRLLRAFPEADSELELAVSGDGSRVAVLGTGLDVFATDSGDRVARLADVEGAKTLSLSQDGRQAAVWDLQTFVLLESGAPRSRSARTAPPFVAVWDLDTGRRLWRDPARGGAEWVFVANDRFLTGPPTRLVEEILRVETGEPLRFGKRIVGISPTGLRVVAAHPLGLALHDVDSGIARPTITRASRVIARSRDGNAALTIGADDAIQLELLGTCRRIRSRRIDGHFGFTDDGAIAFASFAGSEGEHFSAWRVADGRQIWAASTGAGGRVVPVPSRNQVWFQGEDGTIRRFEMASKAELALAQSPRVSYARDGAFAYDVRDPRGDRASRLSTGSIVMRDGQTLVATDVLGRRPVISTWRVDDPRRTSDVPASFDAVFMALSPDERRIAIGGARGALQLFSRENVRETKTVAAHSARVTAIAFSPRGEHLVSVGDDGTVVLVDAARGTVVGRAELPFDRGTYLWFAPSSDEVTVYTARGARVRFAVGGPGP